MKTVATFWKVEEAHLLRLRLCEAGIPAFLQDEHSTQIHPWRAAALGGVRVQVDEADFNAARRMISESMPRPAEWTPLEDSDAMECFRCRALMKPDESRCSSCGWSYQEEEVQSKPPPP